MTASKIQPNYDKRRAQLTLEFGDDLKSSNFEMLKEQIATLLDDSEQWDSEWDTLHLDLSKATLVDSIGLNLLVSIIRRVRERPAEVKATVANSTVYQTLLATRMDKVMELSYIAPQRAQ